MEPSCAKQHEIFPRNASALPKLWGMRKVEQEQERDVDNCNHEAVADKCAIHSKPIDSESDDDDYFMSEEEAAAIVAAQDAEHRARLWPVRRVAPLDFIDDDAYVDDSSDGEEDYWPRKVPLEDLRTFNILYNDSDEILCRYKEAQRINVNEESDEDVIYGPDSSEESKRGEKRREYTIHFMDGKAHGFRCKKVLEEAGCSVLEYCPSRKHAFIARLTFPQAVTIAGRDDIRVIRRTARRFLN